MQVATRPLPSPSGQAAARLPLSPGLVKLAAPGLAFLIGMSLALGVAKGAALLGAMLFLPLALLNLPLAIFLCVPIVFLAQANLLGPTPTLALGVLGLALLGTLARRDSVTVELMREHLGTLAVAALLGTWITLSIGWAANPSFATQELATSLLPMALLGILICALHSERHAQLLAGAFVVGSVAAVLLGLVDDSATAATSALDTATDKEQRLSGAAGDPNFLAAGIVPAVLLGTALFSRRRPFVNAALIGALGLLVVGFGSTESRGGLIASAVALLATLIFYRGRRVFVVTVLAFLVALAALFFTANPHAWERITSFDSAGSGRTDIWRVGWRMSGEHPLIGVGLNNFSVESGRFVRRPGALTRVDQIVDKPLVAHNTYLQFLSETGVVGLALYLAVVIACLGAAWRAAVRFDAAANWKMGLLSRATVVAGIAFLTADFFLSGGADLRLWILLALGPVLLSASKRQSRRAAPRPPWQATPQMGEQRPS